MNLSLSCLVTFSYSLSHSISCAGFYKFVVRDDVISPAGVRNFEKKGGVKTYKNQLLFHSAWPYLYTGIPFAHVPHFDGKIVPRYDVLATGGRLDV